MVLEERVAYCEALAEKIRAERRATKHAHYKNNRSVYLKKAKEWAQSNPEKRRDSKRKWQLDNHERHKGICREWHYKNKYGLTIKERDAMLAAQGGVCAACGADSPGHFRGWCVDHCHVSGRVRGILCHHCNCALGYVRDSVDTLNKLVSYLQR